MKKLSLISIFFFVVAINLYAQKEKSGIGGNLGANYLVGDTPLSDSKIAPNFGLHFVHQYTSWFGMKLQTGFGRLGVVNANAVHWTNIIPLELIGIFSFLPTSDVRPFIHTGIGALSFTMGNSDRYYDGMMIGGVGFNASVTSKLSFFYAMDFRYTTGDDFDRLNGGIKDSYFNVQTGITYHFGKSKSKFKYQEELPDSNVIAQILETEASGYIEQPPTQDENNFSILQAKIDSLKSKLQAKDSEISELKSLSELKSETISQLANQEPISESAPVTSYMEYNTTDVNEAYQQALELFNARNYHETIAVLSDLVDRFPNHPLSSNFEYWIGESYYCLNNYAAALETFEKVLSFEKSHKLDDALIMAGLCYLRLGDNDKATQNFQELLNKYPDSEFADKAKRYLK